MNLSLINSKPNSHTPCSPSLPLKHSRSVLGSVGQKYQGVAITTPSLDARMVRSARPPIGVVVSKVASRMERTSISSAHNDLFLFLLTDYFLGLASNHQLPYRNLSRRRSMMAHPVCWLREDAMTHASYPVRYPLLRPWPALSLWTFCLCRIRVERLTLIYLLSLHYLRPWSCLPYENIRRISLFHPYRNI